MTVTSIKPIRKSVRAYNQYIFGKPHNDKAERNLEVLGVGRCKHVPADRMFEIMKLERERFPAKSVRGGHTRKHEAYTAIIAFSDELDPSDAKDCEKAGKIATEVVEKAYPDRSAMIAIQRDGKSGLLHAHVLINNVDFHGKALRENTWQHLKKHTDEVAKNHGLEPLTAEKNPDSAYDWREDLANRIETAKSRGDLQAAGVTMRMRASKKYPPATASFAFVDSEGKKRNIRGKQLASQLKKPADAFDVSNLARFQDMEPPRGEKKAKQMVKAQEQVMKSSESVKKSSESARKTSDFNRRKTAAQVTSEELNQLYAAKKEFNESYNGKWGKYSEQIKEVREEHAKRWTDEQQQRWDTLAASTRNLGNLKKDLLTLTGKGSWLAGFVYLIVEAKDASYRDQLKVLTDEKTALEQVRDTAIKDAKERFDSEKQHVKQTNAVFDEKIHEVKKDKQTLSQLLAQRKAGNKDDTKLEEVESRINARTEAEAWSPPEQIAEATRTIEPETAIVHRGKRRNRSQEQLRRQEIEDARLLEMDDLEPVKAQEIDEIVLDMSDLEDDQGMQL